MRARPPARPSAEGLDECGRVNSVLPPRALDERAHASRRAEDLDERAVAVRQRVAARMAAEQLAVDIREAVPAARLAHEREVVEECDEHPLVVDKPAAARKAPLRSLRQRSLARAARTPVGIVGVAQRVQVS